MAPVEQALYDGTFEQMMNESEDFDDEEIPADFLEVQDFDTAMEEIKEEIDHMSDTDCINMETDKTELDIPILEISKLNLRDDEMSIFPANRYKIWVHGDNSTHKPPHLHIIDKHDGWEIKYFIENGEIWEIVNSGNVSTKNSNAFNSITKKMKEWFSLSTKMPGRIGTNQETALNEWTACNEY